MCILALAKTFDQQAAYQTMNAQSLAVLISPSRDLRRFLPPPEQERLQSTTQSTINRLRNNGNTNLHLASAPVTVTVTLPGQLQFVPRRDTYVPNYRPLIKTSDVYKYSDAQDTQNNKDTNYNINLEKRPPVIISSEPNNQEQVTQYGTEESPDKDNWSVDTSVNYGNKQPPPASYKEASQTNEKQPFPRHKGVQQIRPNVDNVNTSVHNRDENIENDKIDFEEDKPPRISTMKPSVTSNPSVTKKPSDQQLINGTDVVPNLDQRANFEGDKCATGYIRVNGSTQCIPTD